MISSIKLSQYCLAALTLGCLSVTAVPSSTSFQSAYTNPQSPSSHRGSGRLITQVPQEFLPDTTHDYRGTGRWRQEPDALLVHRGSGRAPATRHSPITAYRGSGRVAPNSGAWQKLA